MVFVLKTLPNCDPQPIWVSEPWFRQITKFSSEQQLYCIAASFLKYSYCRYCIGDLQIAYHLSHNSLKKVYKYKNNIKKRMWSISFSIFNYFLSVQLEPDLELHMRKKINYASPGYTHKYTNTQTDTGPRCPVVMMSSAVLTSPGQWSQMLKSVSANVLVCKASVWHWSGPNSVLMIKKCTYKQ